MESPHLPFILRVRQQVAGIAAAALVAIAYFVVILVALHFLRTDVNPIERQTSEYAVGSYGYLMTSAFLSMSLASFALVIGLYQGKAPPARSRVGLGLMGIWVVGVLIAMIFPIDPEGVPRTTAGTIHRINGPLAFLSLSVGAMLVSRRLNQDENWRPGRRIALILAMAMLATWILIPLSMALDTGLVGLVQRLLLIIFVTWFVLIATSLRSISHSLESQNPI